MAKVFFIFFKRCFFMHTVLELQVLTLTLSSTNSISNKECLIKAAVHNNKSITNFRLPTKRIRCNHSGRNLGWGRVMNRGRQNLMSLTWGRRKHAKETFSQMWFSLACEQKVWVVSWNANHVTSRWHTLLIHFWVLWGHYSEI